MWPVIRDTFSKFHASFHDSEVILWARIQVLVGSVWVVLSTTDLAPLIQNPKYLLYWTIFNGIITEVLRRNRAGRDDDRGFSKDNIK